MYDVMVEREISAAHQLREYRGQCEKYHGHNWRVRLTVTAAAVDKIGLAIDFKELKNMLDRVLERYDHCLLNELPEFSQQNPTSENLAQVIYQRCRESLGDRPVQLKDVTVWESSHTSVRYYE